MMDARHRLHLSAAEAGKVLALKGRHQEALVQYREALRLAFSARAPQVFARHYLHCVLESLEHLGDHQHAAELAGAAADASASPEPTPFQKRDRANLLERRGVNLVKAGDIAGARAALTAALELDDALKLTRSLLEWTARGLSINAARLADAQRKHGYWVVRADSMDADRRADIPDVLPAIREMSHG